MPQALTPAQKAAATKAANAAAAAATPPADTTEPKATETKTRPAKFKVRNTTKHPLNLLSGTIKPDKVGTITNGEYSYLYKKVEIL